MSAEMVAAFLALRQLRKSGAQPSGSVCRAWPDPVCNCPARDDGWERRSAIPCPVHPTPDVWDRIRFQLWEREQ